MKFQTSYSPHKVPGEKNWERDENGNPVVGVIGVSKTVPDLSLTVEEMISRQNRGMDIFGNDDEPLWFGDQEVPNIAHMDLADRMELLERTKDNIRRLQYEMNKEAKERRSKELEDSIRAKIAAENAVVNPPKEDKKEGGTNVS